MPYLSKVMGMNFSAAEVELSFVNSRLTLKNVSLGYIKTPFLTGTKGTCRFDIYEILRGNIKLYDVEVFEGHLNFIKDSKGKWNLPELYEEDTDSSNEDLSVILNFTNIKAYNSSLTLEINGSFPDSRAKVELVNLDIICPSLKSYSNSSLTFKCDIILDQGGQRELIRGNVIASAKGFVNDCLAPDNLQSLISIKDIKSKLDYVNLNGKNFEVSSKVESLDYNNFKINYFEVSELKNKEQGSTIKFNGDLNSFPFRFTFNNCILKLFPDLFMINKQDKLFNYINVAQTQLTFKGQFDLSNSVLENSGEITIDNILIPPDLFRLTLDTIYRTSYDFANKTAVLNKINLCVKRSNKDQVLSLGLHEPLSIYFTEHQFNKSNQLTTANFNFNNTNLKYLNNFIEDNSDFKITSGIASGEVKVAFSNFMELLTFKGNLDINNVGLYLDNYYIKDIDIKNKFDFNLGKLNNFIIKSNQLKVSNAGKSIYDVNLSGNYDCLSSEGNVKFKTGKINEQCDKLLPENIINNYYYKELMKHIAPFEVDLDCGFKINRIQKNINVKSGVLLLKKDEIRAIRVKISNPIKLLWNEKQLINEDIRLTLKLNNIQMSLLNVLMNKKRVNFYSGNLDSFIHYTYVQKENVNRIEGYNVFYDVAFEIDNTRYSNIKQLHNFFDISTKYSNDVLGLNGLLEISRLSLLKTSNQEDFPIGQIRFDLSIGRKLLKFNHLIATINDSNHMILDLSSTISIPIPASSGASIVNLNSEIIDLKKCTNLFYDLFLNNDKDNSPVNAHSEISKNIIQNKDTFLSNQDYLDKININAKINLKKIMYGPYMSSFIKTDVTLKNSLLKIIPELFYVNKTPIHFYFDLLFNEEKNHPYLFKLKFKNFSASPIFKTLDIEGYKQASCMFENVSIDLHGKGIPFSNEMNDKMNGNVKIDIKDISLPDQARKYKLLRIVFIPLEVFSLITNLIPGGLVSKNLIHSLNSTVQIFSLSRNINFKTGKIYLGAVGDKILLNKVLFKGSSIDLINKMSFKGYINLNQKMDLQTNSNISGILVPLEIKGTISNPIPGTMMFLVNFSKNNAINILNPMNLVNLVKGVSDGFENTLKGTYDILSPEKETVKKTINK